MVQYACTGSTAQGVSNRQVGGYFTYKRLGGYFTYKRLVSTGCKVAGFQLATSREDFSR